jgi:hypothetical protein
MRKPGLRAEPRQTIVDGRGRGCAIVAKRGLQQRQGRHAVDRPLAITLGTQTWPSNDIKRLRAGTNMVLDVGAQECWHCFATIL